MQPLMSHDAITVQVRSIGMNSPELLELVENCPVGAETLIMRILYILTEKGEPVM